MKIYVILILALMVSACGGSQTTSLTNQSADGATSPVNSPTSPQAQVQTSSAPVELLSCELTSDKQNVAYKIKINTDRSIDEVHLVLTTTAAGKSNQTTLIWQNIVGSTRRPIESGKIYEDHSPLESGVMKVECSLKEVVFKDGSNWSAK